MDCGPQRDVIASDGEGLILVHEIAHRVLGFVQQWLSDQRFSASRLVLITKGAVAVDAGEDVPGLA